MKRLILISISLALIIVISCSRKSSPAKTNSTSTQMQKPSVTYAANIKTLIQAKCTPCHIPANGGFKTSFDNYEASKKYIDDMIRRIQLTPADKDYMPFKFPKLSDADIAVFKKWKEEGLAE